MAHFKLSTQISRKLHVFEKNVAYQSCKVLSGPTNRELEFYLMVHIWGL